MFKLLVAKFSRGVRHRLSTDHLKMETNLEVVKYICKDFWEETFKKQIDVLKTNNKVCKIRIPPPIPVR